MSLKYLLKDSDVFRHLVHKGRKALKPPTKLSHRQNERQTTGLGKKADISSTPRTQRFHSDDLQPVPGSEMLVKSRSVIRNAKNVRGLGRDRAAGALSPIFPAATAPFPKSCASYFGFARFNMFPLYYLRAWHRLMTCHYQDLGISADWFEQISLAARPIRSTVHIWVVACHQYGISAFVLQTPRPHFAHRNFQGFIITPKME